MAMPRSEYYTAEQVRNFPDDGNRYETAHGELLVTPAPRREHQLVLARLYLAIANYLAVHGIEGALWSPADITFGPDTLVQPDLFVVDQWSVHHAREWADIRELYLVIEALSPSTERADRFTKRRLYQEQRIPSYWIVDIDQLLVEVWTPDAATPFVERDRLVWRHPELDTDCVVELLQIFRELSSQA